MNTLKRTYLPPSMAVDEVELESPICGGSVTYEKDDKSLVNINDQNYATTNGANDFSASSWEIDNTTSAN